MKWRKIALTVGPDIRGVPHFSRLFREKWDTRMRAPSFSKLSASETIQTRYTPCVHVPRPVFPKYFPFERPQALARRTSFFENAFSPRQLHLSPCLLARFSMPKGILFSPAPRPLGPGSRAPCGFHPNIAKSRNFGFCGKLCDFLRFFSGTPRGPKTRDIVLAA